VLAQTYQNWDYTVVDNCSTDGSADIARRYAARDSRIRVHENHHFLPAIPNHNAALRQVSDASKYCKVVFADDWIFPGCLEQMVAVAEEHSSVGLVGAYCLEGRHVICAGLPYSSRVVGGRETCRQHLLNQLYVFGSANSLLYRADLVRSQDPFYNEANIHADTEACFALLKTCDFGFVHQVLTFTRVRPGSLTTVSADLHTYLPGMLHILITYGPHFLTGNELEARLDQHLSEYYSYLGKSMFLGRDTQFWDYHRRQLSEARLPFSRTRLAVAMVANLWRAAVPRYPFIGKWLKARAKPRGAALAVDGPEYTALLGQRPDDTKGAT
jgi:glycosyltransferase involved in cell wall biosynthesis